MKLLSLSVENFGTLHAFTLNCSAGLNTFCRENGAGKTTLAAFLCAMLYGLPNTRRSDIDSNDRKKYQPWQGGPFGGSITFTVHGKIYRAERYFADGKSEKHDTFVLYDLADNSVSHDYSEAIGYELFGLDAAAFMRSACLPQKVLSGDDGYESITERLTRAIGGGDTDTALYSDAAAILDRQRQYYVKQGGRGYIADLENTIAMLHSKEYEAQRAKEQAAQQAAEAEQLADEIELLQREKLQQTAAIREQGARAAVMAHGASLLSNRDAALASAAEKRRFLRLDDTDAVREGLCGMDAADALEAEMGAHARLTVRLEALLETVGEEARTLAMTEERFAGGVPDEETCRQIESVMFSLREAESADDDTKLMTALPDCLSEEELRRHTGQAMMHAQVSELLSRPKTAEADMREAFAAAGMDVGDELPDEDTMQAYADLLERIAANRGKQAALTAAKQTADEKLADFEQDHPVICDRQQIVTMRSRFDALYNRTEEIEELEARQRAAVSADEHIRRNRRRRITVGVVLLLAAAVIACLCAAGADDRLWIVSGLTALPGFSLLLLGLFTRPEESDETRALEDAALKRLCARKSEYEAEKTEIYEFLDRLGGTGTVTDAEEARLRFEEAAAVSRCHGELSEAVKALSEQLAVLCEEEARMCAILTSYTRSGGGELPDSIGDDRAIFAEYRRKLQLCRTSLRAYCEERDSRSKAQAQKDALELALNRYFAALSDACPADAGCIGETGDGSYADRMTAWCRTADILRLQTEQMQRVREDRRAVQKQLTDWIGAVLCDSPTVGESDTASVTSHVEEIIALARGYRTCQTLYTEHLQTKAELENDLLKKKQEAAKRLSVYFPEPPEDAAEGLRMIRAAEAALAVDMQTLLYAQRQLAAFLAEHGLTEEDVSNAAQNSMGRNDPASDTGIPVLEEKIRVLTESRAALLQSSDTQSRIGGQLSEIRERIGTAEQTLSDAKAALETIRRTQACLETAKQSLSTRYLSHMQNRFRYYYAEMNGLSPADMQTLSLDAAFSVQAEVYGARRDAGYFSRGTRDCINFCVRLALIDAMFTDGGTKHDAPMPPLLLDDPFVNLDEAHLAKAKRLLKTLSDRQQIFYFVCHESRA